MIIVSDAGPLHYLVGELAAITLAEQLQADLVLMDDLDGRIEAERRHLRVIGTLGVLRDAAFHG